MIICNVRTYTFYSGQIWSELAVTLTFLDSSKSLKCHQHILVWKTVWSDTHGQIQSNKPQLKGIVIAGKTCRLWGNPSLFWPFTWFIFWWVATCFIQLSVLRRYQSGRGWSYKKWSSKSRWFSSPPIWRQLENSYRMKHKSHTIYQGIFINIWSPKER